MYVHIHIGAHSENAGNLVYTVLAACTHAQYTNVCCVVSQYSVSHILYWG